MDKSGFNEQRYLSATLPYLALIVTLVFLYVRPQETITLLKPLRIPGALGMFILIWFMFNIRRHLIFNKYIFRIILLIFVFLIASIGANNVIGYRRVITWSTYYFPILASIYLLVCSKLRFESFFITWSVMHLLVALVVIKNGGVGPGDFISDENDVALALGMAIPFAFYVSQWRGLTTAKRNLIILSFLMMSVSVILTQSRGGLLGLATVFGMIFLFSNRRLKIAFWGTLIAVVFSGVILSVLPEGYVEDVVSGLTDSGDSTRVERFRSWEIAWIMFLDNFFLGVGPGNFAWNVIDYQAEASWWYEGAKSLHGRQVHSLYFELLADVGFVGTFLYFSTLFLAARHCFKIIRQTKTIEDERYLAELHNIRLVCRALIVSICCFMISGAFISVAYYPHAIFWVTLCVITFRYYDYVVKQIDDTEHH